MNYAGGENPTVSAQPPQVATQYALPASINAIPAPLSSGSASSSAATSRRNRFPCGHSGAGRLGRRGFLGGFSINCAKSKPQNADTYRPANGAYAASIASSQQISSQAASLTFSSSLWLRIRTTEADDARLSAKFRRNRALSRTIFGSTRSLNPPFPSSFPERSNSPAIITDHGDGSGTVCPFPHSHIYATPTAHALPGEHFSRARNSLARKGVSSGNRHINNDFTFAAVTNPRDRRPAVLPAGAVGPAGVAPFSPRRASSFPHRRKARLLPRPSALRSLSKAFRQSAELSRGSVRLFQSRPIKPHRSGFVLLTPDHSPDRKIYADDRAHVARSKCASRLKASPQ